MSETPEQQTPTGPTTPIVHEPAEPDRRPSRLTAVAAWVGIVAGVVFVVAVVFFSGYVLGAHSGDGDRDYPRGHREVGTAHHEGPPPGFPMGPRGDFDRPMFPGGPGGPGGAGGPGGPGGPGEPTTTAPTSPARP